MGVVWLNITTSLDGFVAGPNDDVARLHEWLFAGDIVVKQGSGEFRLRTEADATNFREMLSRSGAIVMGKRTSDLGSEPWGDDPPFPAPCFVVTHESRPTLRKGRTSFTFVTGGIERAIALARDAAGATDVQVMGGASTAQQAVSSGLLDEIELHIVPLLLGDGKRLFPDGAAVQLEQTQIVPSVGVTHTRYRVVKSSKSGGTNARWA